MRRHLALLLLAAAALAGAAPAAAQPRPAAASCADSPLGGGANARVCLPVGVPWGGDALVYVPGFAPAPGFRNLALPDGTQLPDLVAGLGYAFATTDVGLVDDTRELVRALPALLPGVRRVYVAGVSQGGMVAALLAERPPALVRGALDVCGPIGDYGRQVDYIGDFRVLFDYFFPGQLPASPVSIPQSLVDGWPGTYAPQVAQAVAASPAAAAQLVTVAGAAVDSTSPQALATSTVSTTLSVLYYNVYGTNPAAARYGGNVYGNQGRAYAGSADDTALNAGVARFTAEPAARAGLAEYETSGVPGVPLVALHTSGDEVVPAWQVDLYGAKVAAAGARGFTRLVVQRYGHCNVTRDEILAGFLTLSQQADQWRFRANLPDVKAP